jgi:hypothetical protein
MSDFRDVVGRDELTGNDGDRPGYTLPVGPTEIDELLYNEEWSADERIERLLAMRRELAELESPDFGDDDPLTLVRRIDDAVAQLRGLDGEGMDPAGMDMDPSAHRETMSPDSDELLDLEELDEQSLTSDDGEDGPIDEREWIDGDGFDPDKGVR